MISHRFFFVVVFATLVSSTVLGQGFRTRGPDSLLSYTATVSSSSPKELVLSYTSVALDSGYYEHKFLLPDGLIIDSSNTSIFAGTVHHIGDTLKSVVTLKMPDSGYYWSHLAVSYAALAHDSINVNFALLRNNPLYYEVKDSSVDSVSSIPDSIFYPKMSVLDTGGRSLRAERQKGATPQSNDWTIQISGHLQYKDCDGTYRGIPDVNVVLDWSGGLNGNDIWFPFASTDGDNNHVQYAKTDQNGYYSFDLDASRSDHVSDWTSKFRLLAQISNNAGYQEELGNGGYWPEFAYVSVSTGNDNISSTTADINVDPVSGEALRMITRAFEFDSLELGYTTPLPLMYTIRPDNSGISYFQAEYYDWDICADCFGLDGINGPHIMFHTSTVSEIAYHEFGHWLEYSYLLQYGYDMYGTDIEKHSWSQQTDYNTAWTEGWAEFHCAAAHTYWYTQDGTSSTTMEKVIYGPDYYQWPDYSADDNVLTEKGQSVEGSVASFLYDLWDNTQQRAESYQGDNEDLQYPASLIMASLLSMHGWDYTAPIDNFYNAFKQAVYLWLNQYNDLATLHFNSITACYQWLMGTGPKARPATPDQLNVAGDCSKRTLTWNDNTEPSSISYPARCSGTATYDLHRNNEDGFKIYRKSVSAGYVWDGTFDGYSEIGHVATDITTYQDHTFLKAGGWYSYVVTAYDSHGTSIPRAETIINIAPCSTIKITVNPSTLCTSWTRNIAYIAEPTNPGGLHYAWRSPELLPYIALAGGDTEITTVTNNWGPSYGAIADSVHIICDVSGTSSYSDTAVLSLIGDSCAPYSPIYPIVTQSPHAICPGSSASLGVVDSAGIYAWQLYGAPSYVSHGSLISPVLTLTNEYNFSSGPDTTTPFAVQCIITHGANSDTSDLFYPELSYDTSCGSLPSPNRIVPASVSASLTGNGTVSLDAIYPNPSNGLITIPFTLSSASRASIFIYDVLGNIVSIVGQNVTEPDGHNTASFDGRNLPAGSYVCSIVCAYGRASRLFIVHH